MSFQGTASDVVVRIASDNSLAPERRISPSWSIALLRSKLEIITGVPPSFQRLTLRLPHNPEPIPIEAADEESVLVASFPFQPYAELHVRTRRFSHQLLFFPFFFLQIVKPGSRLTSYTLG